MATMQADLSRLFSIDFAGRNEIYRHQYIIIVCRDSAAEDAPYAICECDRLIYQQSPVCSKRSKVITRAEFEAAGAHCMRGYGLVRDTQLALIFDEPYEYFVDGYLNTAQDFYSYIVFADKHMLNIWYICSKVEYTAWLLVLKERQKEIWRVNKILLCNTEQKAFDKVKTMVPPPRVRYTRIPTRYVNIEELAAPPFLSQQALATVFDILQRNDAHDFMTKLFTVISTSMEYHGLIMYTPLINISIPSRCRSAAMFYNMRLLYLEEVALYDGARKTADSVIDLDVAAALHPSRAEGMNNPYFCAVVKNASRALILPAYLAGLRGIYTAEMFERRYGIFTGGILAGIPWSSGRHKTAVIGSSITACAMITPLEMYFDDTASYFAEYYPQRPRASPRYSLGDIDDDDCEYTDINLLVECAAEAFRDVLAEHWAVIQPAIEAQYPYLIPTIETYTSCEMLHCGRYTISIERVENIPAAVVAQPLGCTRAWYDGKTVRCFPSFICAAMTGLNVDIRTNYISTHGDEAEQLIMKYFQRGFGTLVNNIDADIIVSHIIEEYSWPPITDEHGTLIMPLFRDQLEIFNPSRARIGLHLRTNIPPHKIENLRVWNTRGKNKLVFRSKKRAILPSVCGPLAEYY